MAASLSQMQRCLAHPLFHLAVNLTQEEDPVIIKEGGKEGRKQVEGGRET